MLCFLLLLSSSSPAANLASPQAWHKVISKNYGCIVTEHKQHSNHACSSHHSYKSAD